MRRRTFIGTGTGGGGNLSGSIADGQIAFGDGTSIAGSEDFKWISNTLSLSSSSKYRILMPKPEVSIQYFDSDGSLAQGNYFIVVTAVDLDGGEIRSDEETFNVPPGDDDSARAVITVPVISGATYRLYVGTISGGENQYFESFQPSFNLTQLNGTFGELPASDTAYSVSLPNTITSRTLQIHQTPLNSASSVATGYTAENSGWFIRDSVNVELFRIFSTKPDDDNPDDPNVGNLFIGAHSGENSTGAGYENVAVGPLSLQALIDGYWNTAVGANALFLTTEGAFNTAFGGDAARLNTTGSHNTNIGTDANYNNETGSFNTALGSQAGLDGSHSNTLVLGYAVVATTDNRAVIGNENVTDAYFGSELARSAVHSASSVFHGATSGSITHSVPATITSYEIKWPSAQGTAGQFLKIASVAGSVITMEWGT